MLCIGSEPLVLYQITENHAGIMPNVVIRSTCQDWPNIYLRIYTKVDADCTTFDVVAMKKPQQLEKKCSAFERFPFSFTLYC